MGILLKSRTPLFNHWVGFRSSCLPECALEGPNHFAWLPRWEQARLDLTPGRKLRQFLDLYRLRLCGRQQADGRRCKGPCPLHHWRFDPVSHLGPSTLWLLPWPKRLSSQSCPCTLAHRPGYLAQSGCRTPRCRSSTFWTPSCSVSAYQSCQRRRTRLAQAPQ